MRRIRSHSLRHELETLEERRTPANLKMTDAILVDTAGTQYANPVFGQDLLVRARFLSQAMAGGETAILRFTVNGIPQNTTPLASYPAGNAGWQWQIGGWYIGTAAISVTATLDPDNLLAETDETDNSYTFTVTPVSPMTLPNKFLFPISGTAFRDWGITNYADVDPRTGITADFRGGPYQYDQHDAIDAGPVNFERMDSGMPIWAAADGVVDAVSDGNFDRETTSGNRPGNYVQINHGNNWKTLYYHFAQGSITVKVGDSVKAGQTIGLIGSSGNSTGMHLHYTAFFRGLQVEAGFSPASYWSNPLPYAGDAPASYMDTGITNYNSSNDLSERVSRNTAYGTADAAQTLYFYVRPYHIKTTDVMTWKFIRPNGTTLQTSNFASNGNYAYSTWWWTLPLSSFQSAPGTWSVDFILNGVSQSVRTFTVASGSGAPAARMTDAAGLTIADGRTSVVDFGAVAVGGTAIQKSFTILNHGNSALALANYALPPGFSLVSGPASVAAGGSGTIILRLDSAIAGAKYGAFRVATNDPDTPLFDFIVSGTVTGTVTTGSPALDLDGSALTAINPGTAYYFGAEPRLLAPSGTVADSNSTQFGGGSLTAELASFGDAEDRLTILHQGLASGLIGLSGFQVLYGGVFIGTWSGGTGTTPLTVSLNSNASLAAAQALLRDISYRSVAVAPSTQRKSIRFTLVDDTGLASNLAIQHVVQTGEAKNPTVNALPNRTVTRGAALAYSGSFADPYGLSWSATVDYGDGSGTLPLALNPDKTFLLSHAYTANPGVYSVTVKAVNNLGGSSTATMQLTVAPAVGVSAVQVNDGGVQRSRVTELRVTFSGLVVLPATAANAFELLGPNGAIALTVDTSLSTATQTIARLRFIGAGLDFGSLKDGNYTLRVRGSLILDANGGGVDGDRDGIAGGDRLTQFHRLFGDTQGSHGITSIDARTMSRVLASDLGTPLYLWYLDFDGNGRIDKADLLQFNARYGIVLP